VNRGPATYGWPTTQQLRGEKCIYVTNNIDLSAAKPQRLTQELANDAALVRCATISRFVLQDSFLYEYLRCGYPSVL
jgi:hypothetical protein